MAVFSKEQQNSVWEKGIIVDGYDPNIVRKDACGAWILRSKYDVRDSPFGWQIDHIYPESRLIEKGVSEDRIDNIVNLRPLHFKNNISKADDFPFYSCAMKSEGDHNVEFKETFQINIEIQKDLKEFFNL